MGSESMKKEIRLLGPNDFVHIQNLKTNVVDDYIPQAFPDLIELPNVLYGLFVDDKLASVAGYTLFGNKVAMLGRLRSDLRFHGHGFATEIMAYVRDIAFKDSKVRWVGANTQAANKPTQRVLNKIGLIHHMTAYGAISSNVMDLETGAQIWNKIDDLPRKQAWLHELYPEETDFFPYGCYYLLPSSKDLFTDQVITDWIFYENEDETRVVIMKHDEKKQTYVHVVYPWDDITKQAGLWKTITEVQQQFVKQFKNDVFIWMDLTEDAVCTLPHNHPFELPSPWTLHGVYRNS